LSMTEMNIDWVEQDPPRIPFWLKALTCLFLLAVFGVALAPSGLLDTYIDLSPYRSGKSLDVVIGNKTLLDKDGQLNLTVTRPPSIEEGTQFEVTVGDGAPTTLEFSAGSKDFSVPVGVEQGELVVRSGDFDFRERLFFQTIGAEEGSASDDSESSSSPDHSPGSSDSSSGASASPATGAGSSNQSNVSNVQFFSIMWTKTTAAQYNAAIATWREQEKSKGEPVVLQAILEEPDNARMTSQRENADQDPQKVLKTLEHVREVLARESPSAKILNADKPAELKLSDDRVIQLYAVLDCKKPIREILSLAAGGETASGKVPQTFLKVEEAKRKDLALYQPLSGTLAILPIGDLGVIDPSGGISYKSFTVGSAKLESGPSSFWRSIEMAVGDQSASVTWDDANVETVVPPTSDVSNFSNPNVATLYNFPYDEEGKTGTEFRLYYRDSEVQAVVSSISFTMVTNDSAVSEKAKVTFRNLPVWAIDGDREEFLESLKTYVADLTTFENPDVAGYVKPNQPQLTDIQNLFWFIFRNRKPDHGVNMEVQDLSTEAP